ncbi:MAG: N-acetylmuramoyl-L-alanine amidase [Treponema sp.]|nr:N-acetylmuramoyl-L-alanine amidase [Treponema sp.]
MKRIVFSSAHGLHVPGANHLINEVEESRRVIRDVAIRCRKQDLASVFEFHDGTSKNQNDNLNTIIGWHNSLDRDLDVSVHFNAFKATTTGMGVEVLYRDPENRHLAAAVSVAIAKAGGLRNRGARPRTNLRFLNQVNRPAILIEVCFTDSEVDVQLYKLNYEDICQAIAVAVTK